MIEKIEDVIKIEVSKFRFSANIYLIDDTLIDTGFPRTAGKLLDCLKDKKISKIVNTHGHIDHIGGNGIIQR
ncbi:MAG: MBL fold metallo-hydrolase, partial [Methanomicrobia archaeon]|nr:MBL fold metallo-hydrolase [Methanomicrobia archaeon]